MNTNAVLNSDFLSSFLQMPVQDEYWSMFDKPLEPTHLTTHLPLDNLPFDDAFDSNLLLQPLPEPLFSTESFSHPLVDSNKASNDILKTAKSSQLDTKSRHNTSSSFIGNENHLPNQANPNNLRFKPYQRNAGSDLNTFTPDLSEGNKNVSFIPHTPGPSPR
jgi:hypothetical protein